MSSAAEPAADEMSTLFTFSLADVTARATPSATTAWTVSGATFSGSFRESAVLRDSDHDGAVRWNIGHLLPANGIISVVDMSARAIHAAAMDGTVVELEPLEATFLRGRTGHYDHVDLQFGWSYLLMWVRPGVGAWTKLAANGSFGDVDDELNEIAGLPRRRPAGGNSPAAPVQLQPGPGYLVVDGAATCTIVNDDTGAVRRSRSVRH